MVKKFLTYVFLTTLLLFTPSTLFASDLEITCFSDRSPEFLRNTDPLFEISGFAPGDSASRIVLVENTDPENPCWIFFRVSGNANVLTDKIVVEIPGLFNGTLSEYIGSNVRMANLNPGEQVTREITMALPTDAGNVYARRQASFDIIVQSEWGDDAVIDDDGTTPAIAGVIDFFTEFVEGMIGIGMQDVVEIEGGEVDGEETEEEQENDEDILGIADGEECTERTLWWIPLVGQLILTFFVIFLKKSFLKYKRVKLIVSIVLGLISFFLIRWIGCGCNPVWLCTYHWIPNTAIALSPALTYLKKKTST